MKIAIVAIILIILVVSFIILWYVNHNTPIPNEAFDNLPECNGCSNKSCGNYKK
ncbi:MAG: hypothetical protein ACK5NF_04970 [Bacilli bacterium]